MTTTQIVDTAAQYVRMEELLTAMYRKPFGSPERDAIVEEYDAIVELLLATLGENTHCSKIDIEMFSLFSDLYKDRTGVRPRGELWSYARVKAWLDDDASITNAA
jgi:hypothetical protein